KRSLELPPENYLWTEILGRRIYYSLDTFFQANLYILPSFIERLRALDIWGKNSVFFDLYGGVGLFGLCVYDLVDKVVLIEAVPASLKLAKYNAAYHQLSQFIIEEGRVEDILPGKLALMTQTNNIVMVDPPRAGLSPQTVEMLNGVSNTNYLIYLSCNPQSLVENCWSLKDRWEIHKILPVDFFPRTQHLETLVILRSKT
ncbi:MAG: hypothetical protein JNN05_00335, partial [Candidatus Omnitrophica bacterium]|nr:hypothetical protein [Candidatus Omnitrophota bacterium]